MSNIFQEVISNVQDVETNLLGPVYPYYKNINTPSSIGISSDGSISALTRDIEGLIAYVELLVQGGGDASSTGKPLGNQFFLKTGAKCMDTETKEEVDRYIYVNNIPNGNIPFISSGLGKNFSEFKGLIPGAMSNLNVLNPYALLQSFMAGSTPSCQSLTMQVTDNSNNSYNETNYVTLTDIQNMDPCNFPGGSNPITGKSCVELFTNNNNDQNENPKKNKRNNNNDNNNGLLLPKDTIVQLYFLGLAAVGVYILYKVMEKSKK